MTECRGRCKMPKLKSMTPCVARCARCGRYWELRTAWVPYAKAARKEDPSDG